MPITKEKLLTLCIVSLLTTAFIIVCRYIGVPFLFFSSQDGLVGFILANCVVIFVNMLASIPGMWLLALAQFRCPVLLSVFAIFEAYWLGYALSPYFLAFGLPVWIALNTFVVLGAYLLSFSLLQANNGRLSKIGILLALAIITVVSALYAALL